MENYRATRILSARWRNSAQKTVKPRSSWAGWPCFVFEMRSQLSGPAEDSKVLPAAAPRACAALWDAVGRGLRGARSRAAPSVVRGRGGQGAAARWRQAGGWEAAGRRRPCLKTRWAAFQNVPNREPVSMWWFASSPFSN